MLIILSVYPLGCILRVPLSFQGGGILFPGQTWRQDLQDALIFIILGSQNQRAITPAVPGVFKSS